MRTKLFTVLAVAVMAFLLATNPMVGNAAGGLTKGAVKKIAAKSAAKVIASKAPGLSVSHATTANSATTASSATTAATADTAQNATRLNGRPADNYLTTSYRYALPAKAASNNPSYTFPGLPAGSYLLNYSASFMYTATSGQQLVSCQVTPTSANNGYVAAVFGTVVSTFATISASGSITTPSTGSPVLQCFSNGGTIISNTAAGFDNAVTFTRIDTVTPGLDANLTGQARPNSAGLSQQ